MIEKIDLLDPSNQVLLSLPVSTPSPSAPYFIKGVEGLVPVDSEISTTTYANQPGSLFQTSHIGTRNIVLSIGYNKKHLLTSSIQTLRRNLYRLFKAGEQVSLRFKDNGPILYSTIGYVESVDTTIFSQDPAIQISIICMDPYFSDFYSKVYTGTTGTDLDVSNTGDVDTGFIFYYEVLQAESSITLTTTHGGKLVYALPFVAGDKVTISTVPGNKYSRYSRDGRLIVDFDGIVEGDLNMSFRGGDEGFKAVLSSGTAKSYTLWHTPKYQGL